MKSTITQVAKHVAYEYGLNYKDVLYVLERLEEKMSEPIFRQYSDGNWFADIDGKRIARKSLFTARVYTEPYDPKAPFIEYKSRIEHCGSCLEDNEYEGILDECCSCVHGKFHNKHEENEYVKSVGFWKIPFAESKKLEEKQ